MVWTHKLDKVFLLVNNTIVKFPPLSLMLHKFSLGLNLYILQFAFTTPAVQIFRPLNFRSTGPKWSSQSLHWEECFFLIEKLHFYLWQQPFIFLTYPFSCSYSLYYLLYLQTLYFHLRGISMEFSYFLTGILFCKTF